jgi:hypothetical protein
MKIFNRARCQDPIRFLLVMEFRRQGKIFMERECSIGIIPTPHNFVHLFFWVVSGSSLFCLFCFFKKKYTEKAARV